MLTAFHTETAAFQFEENYVWIQNFGINYHVGVDGISMLMILLTTFLSVIAVIGSWNYVKARGLAFFIAFAIKVPMFPVHTWLPVAHVEAPTAGSVILAGVLLKMGVYGMIRFCIGFFPEVTVKAIPWVMVLSVIGIIYGAAMSLIQSDMKRLVAYSSVSHMGFITMGLFALRRIV